MKQINFQSKPHVPFWKGGFQSESKRFLKNVVRRTIGERLFLSKPEGKLPELVLVGKSNIVGEISAGIIVNASSRVRTPSGKSDARKRRTMALKAAYNTVDFDTPAQSVKILHHEVMVPSMKAAHPYRMHLAKVAQSRPHTAKRKRK